MIIRGNAIVPAQQRPHRKREKHQRQLRRFPCYNTDVIATAQQPLKKEAGMAVLKAI